MKLHQFSFKCVQCHGSTIKPFIPQYVFRIKTTHLNSSARKMSPSVGCGFVEDCLKGQPPHTCRIYSHKPYHYYSIILGTRGNLSTHITTPQSHLLECWRYLNCKTLQCICTHLSLIRSFLYLTTYKNSCETGDSSPGY